MKASKHTLKGGVRICSKAEQTFAKVSTRKHVKAARNKYSKVYPATLVKQK
jgi:hypothetical protein